MALGDTYAEIADLKPRLGIDLANTDYDDQLQDAVDSASREIERWCNRQFNKQTSATARKFAATSKYCAVIDDFHTEADLVIKSMTDDDGVFDKTWASSEFELRPANGVVSGQTGWPFWRIKAVSGETFPLAVPGERAFRLEVTAQWGWDAVPSPVRQACLMLAAKNFMMKDAPLGLLGNSMNEFGATARVMDDRLVMAKLRTFRRDSVLVR